MNIVEFNFPKEMEEILTILSSNNVNYWLFGGSVRDLFTNATPNDYDFVITGMCLEEVNEILEKNNIKSFIVSQRMNVLGISPNNINCEFACCKERKDLISYLKSLDFTCNSILLDLESGNIIDVFNGYQDIKNKKIKSIIPPKSCYSMKPTHMIRAVYVATKTGFDIDEEDIQAIRSNNISAFDEPYRLMSTRYMTEMISTPNCERGFQLLDKVGILGKEFPILGRRLENGLINFDALRYINDNVREENATSETDDRTILQFLNIFECEKQNINKFYFYNEYKQHISKILQLAVHYNRFLGNLSVNDIDKLMIDQHIKSKYRRAVLRIILELKDIKSIVKKNNETKLNPEK